MSIQDVAGQFSLDHGRLVFDLLRQKWGTIPSGLAERTRSDVLLCLNDRELTDYWEGVRAETSIGAGFPVRGWYHKLYADVFAGRRVLEIGSGMGIDGIHFIRNGASWYFADIVCSNLTLIKRILAAFDLPYEGMKWIEDLKSFDEIPADFDFIYCQGSLINVPFQFARAETLHIVSKLKLGGRWIELCYPKERWIRDGQLPPTAWGHVTDGESTPWMEWYDLDRLRERFYPVDITPVVSFNFHQNDFNWFDLAIDQVPSGEAVQRLVRLSATEKSICSVSLQQHKVHHAIKLEEDAGCGLFVVTGPKRWFFALQFPLTDYIKQVGTDSTVGGRGGLSVLVDLQVQDGSVGVGLVDENLHGYLGSELNAEAADGVRRLTIPIPRRRDQVHLIFRNTAGGDVPSSFHISSISLEASPEAMSENRDWSDIASSLSLTDLVRRHWSKIGSEQTPGEEFRPPVIPVFVRAVNVEEVGGHLGYAAPFKGRSFKRRKSYMDRRMEDDDGQLLAYIYRNHRPQRHLEFGTWEGFGVVLCAENCDAEIWTLNLPEGERTAEGEPVYCRAVTAKEGSIAGVEFRESRTVQTDAGRWIGWRYRAAGYDTRVHQIFCDSTTWDSSTFADGFFDSILIDGGHESNVVASDTNMSLRLLRPGGLLLWHDFCPVDLPISQSANTRGVVHALHTHWYDWSRHFEALFWVRPTYLLIGRKRAS
jgi:predicted O-methyltransferase YrrM